MRDPVAQGGWPRDRAGPGPGELESGATCCSLKTVQFVPLETPHEAEESL